MHVRVLTAAVLAVGVVFVCGSPSVIAQDESIAHRNPPLAWIAADAEHYPPVPRYRTAPYPPQFQPPQAPPPAAPYPTPDSTSQLQAELAASRAELQRTSERLRAAQMLLQQARDALARNYSEHQRLRGRQSEQTAQLNAAQIRVSGLTDELKTVHTTLAEQQAQLAEYSALKNEFTQQQATAQRLQAHSVQLEEQHASAESRLQSCQARLTALDADLTRAQTVQATTERSLTESLEERDRLQTALSDATAELQARQADLTQAEAATTAASATRDAVQAQLTALQAETRRDNIAQNASVTEASLLAERLRDTEALLEAERSTKTAMQQAVADATRTRERLLTQLDGLDTRISGAQSPQQAAAQVQTAQNELQRQLLSCTERLSAAKIAFSTSGVFASAAAEADARSRAARSDDPGSASGGSDAASAMPTELAALEPATVRAGGADGDGDGIADRLDLCPDSPAATATDATGCAANVPIALPGVSFRYDSDALTDASRRVLDRVAGILREQPALRLEIAGHSDAQGDAAYNLWLSEQRARSVMAYLVVQGVGTDRLSARGYGGTQPIAENTTREGLARNRRVELRRLP